MIIKTLRFTSDTGSGIDVTAPASALREPPPQGLHALGGRLLPRTVTPLVASPHALGMVSEGGCDAGVARGKPVLHPAAPLSVRVLALAPDQRPADGRPRRSASPTNFRGGGNVSGVAAAGVHRGLIGWCGPPIASHLVTGRGRHEILAAADAKMREIEPRGRESPHWPRGGAMLAPPTLAVLTLGAPAALSPRTVRRTVAVTPVTASLLRRRGRGCSSALGMPTVVAPQLRTMWRGGERSPPPPHSIIPLRTRMRRLRGTLMGPNDVLFIPAATTLIGTESYFRPIPSFTAPFTPPSAGLAVLLP